MASAAETVTVLLAELRAGSQDALNRLIPLVYTELHRLAERYMRQERIGHTLQPTALVNEAYMRLLGYQRMDWQSRAHFIRVAAGVMRRILVEYARKRQALIRGGDVEKVPLEENDILLSQQQSEELIDLDTALKRLEVLDARQSEIVSLRFFGGLTVEETAEALGISPKTVKREWAVARAWLHGEVSKGASA
jgi:RNA polymerase sigma factor (TIGR02999 family)